MDIFSGFADSLTKIWDADDQADEATTAKLNRDFTLTHPHVPMIDNIPEQYNIN